MIAAYSNGTQARPQVLSMIDDERYAKEVNIVIATEMHDERWTSPPLKLADAKALVLTRKVHQTGEPSVYRVESGDAKGKQEFYTVSVGSPVACTCPQAVKTHKVCKHETAVAIYCKVQNRLEPLRLAFPPTTVEERLAVLPQTPLAEPGEDDHGVIDDGDMLVQHETVMVDPEDAGIEYVTYDKAPAQPAQPAAPAEQPPPAEQEQTEANGMLTDEGRPRCQASPPCTRAATVEHAGIPLCLVHAHMVETGPVALSRDTAAPKSPGVRPIADILRDLRTPLPRTCVATKQGQKGTRQSYIHWQTAVRVLDHYAPGWRGEIVRIEAMLGHCMIVYRITIPCQEGEVWREATGSEVEGFSGYGDLFSNAEAQAFKRAAAKFGVALDLYDRDETGGEMARHLQGGRPVPDMTAQTPEAQREAIKATLERLGFHPTTQGDARHLIKRLTRYEFDVANYGHILAALERAAR